MANNSPNSPNLINQPKPRSISPISSSVGSSSVGVGPRPSSPLANKPITNQSQSQPTTSISAPSPLARQVGLTRQASPPGSISGRPRQDSSSSSRSTATTTSLTTSTNDQSDSTSIDSGSEDYNHYKLGPPSLPLGMGPPGTDSSQPISISTSISPISSIQPQTARLSTTPLYPSPLAYSSGPADDHDANKPDDGDDDGDGATEPSEKGSPHWAKNSPRGSLRGSPLARDGQILFEGEYFAGLGQLNVLLC